MQNLAHNQFGTIDADIEVNGEWLPTTIDSDHELYEAAMQGAFGEIAPYVEPEIDIQTYYDERIADIHQWLNEQLQPISARYSAAERETWELQRQEALSYQANDKAATPMIDTLIHGRDITKQAMVATILHNAKTYRTLVATAMNQAQRWRDAADRALADNDKHYFEATV